MSERARDALPSDVAALVELERRSAPALDGARTRVAARLGLEGVASAPPAGAAGGWGSLVVPLTVVALAAAGGGVWLASRSSTDVAVPARPAQVAREEVVAPPPPAVTMTPPASPGAPPRARTPAAPGTEVALLASARKALAGGNPRSALALVRRHERTWPRGELVQEREVVAIQALVAAGAVDQARARADLFLSRFPGSTLIETVRQLRDAMARTATTPRQ